MPRIYEVQLTLDFGDRGYKTVDCEVEWSSQRSFWNCPREIYIHRVFAVDGETRHELPDFLIPIGELLDAIRDEEIDMAETHQAEARADV